MVVTKPADFRSKQKEYFETAYNGEPVVIARPRNENVVIISDDEYRKMESHIRALTYYYKLRESKSSCSSREIREAVNEIKQFE